MRDSETERFSNEYVVSQQITDGAIPAGFANHYYAMRVKNQRPDAPIDLAFTAGDAVALVLPLGWLFVELSDLGWQSFELMAAPTTLWVLVRSVALVTVVTATSVVIGASMAVLTVQTDVPFRRFWTIVGALPLAIPSYLGALAAVSAFGPRGALADALAPLGIDRLPTVYGFGGAAVVLALYTYPYVFLTTRAALLSLDGSLIEAARTV